MRHLRPRHLSIVTLAAILASPGWAQKTKQGNDPLDAVAVDDPITHVASWPIDADVAIPSAATEAFRQFRARNGGTWLMFVDRVTGSPAMIEGSGIPWIAGGGNRLEGSSMPSRDAMVAKARAFMAANPGLLAARPEDLVINEVATGPVLDYLYFIHFDWTFHGIPVEGAQVLFRVNHGNLVQMGTDRVSASIADLDPSAPVTRDQAWAIVREHAQGGASDVVVDEGHLVVMPVSAYVAQDVTQPSPIAYRMVWVLSFRRAGVMGTWEARVDAQSGALLRFKDANRYGQIQGGAYVTDKPQVEAEHPFPFADYGAGQYADASGRFAGTTGTSTMSGQFVNTNDVCGAASLGADPTGLIDFSMSSGTDCITPGVGGNGNTHSSRTQYFNVEAIREVASYYLPANAWLQGTLGVTVNLNQVCNAYWNGSTLNFFRSGGGCGNTGELPGVSLHEWGHGFDQNDGIPLGGGTEAYADISWVVFGHVSCVGAGFYNAGNCTGYGDPCLNCSGIRDHDYTQHQSGVPATPLGFDQPNCCCGGGPCGGEEHCETAPPSQAMWDLGTRDLITWGLDQTSAWMLVDKLWYSSRPTAGQQMFSCTNNNSCSAGDLFNVLRVIDDCDGNLANGTPHASAIFGALGRHQIGCASAVNTDNACACPSLSAPTLSATPGNNQIVLNWTPVPNAATYDVLRNEVSCTTGFLVIGNTASTTFTDTNVVNGFTYYYRVQARGATAACPAGVVSNCVTVVPQNCPAITLSPATLPNGTVGVPYSQTITASGGAAPYTFAVTLGTLPAGLLLNGGSGVVSGTPTAPGTSSFTITATDSAGCAGSLAYQLVIDCPTITVNPASLPNGSVGTPYSQTITASGGTAPYTFTVSAGTLPTGLALAAGGVLSGTPAAAGTFTFSVSATDAGSCAGTRQYTVVISQVIVVDHVTGEGLGAPNPNRVRVYTGAGTATTVDFLAYGGGAWGVNVASGNIDGGANAEILTGPGPGPTFGPQVRGFNRAGAGMGKVNYYAYGTLKYGANVSEGDVENDGFDEIVTGAGPGAVFGPHVRGWNFDGNALTPISKISYFAYGTLKYGVNVNGGSVDADRFSEILTGAGPSPTFAPTIRGWNYDGSGITSINKINFNPFTTLQYGVNVASGDFDADGIAEIAAAPGPGAGAGFPSRFLGFNYDGATITSLNGFDVVAYTTTTYGGRVGAGDVSQDGQDDLVTGAGRDPAADATVKAYDYTGSALTPLSSTFNPFAGATYGVNATGALLGY
ncbi:MAG: Ig domain-containing protein [Acidobacteriota bacterium]